MKSEPASRPFSGKFINVRPLAGYFGHNSYITQQFIRACEAVGIPAVPDVNTSKGTLGVTKVLVVHMFY